MIANFFLAFCLVAITVIIHAAGLAFVLERIGRSPTRPQTRFWPIACLLFAPPGGLIVFPLLEIAVWGLFFWWERCLPDAESSFYFSGVTYATIGYGDLVL